MDKIAKAKGITRGIDKIKTNSIDSIKNVINPDKIKKQMDDIYKDVVKPSVDDALRMTMDLKKKILDIQLPSLGPEIAGIGAIGKTIGDLLNDAKETLVKFDGEGNLIDAMLESDSAKAWGTLADGTNQGVKHFNTYWELYPDRIPSLANRLGVDPNDFANTVQGFENFTNSAKNVMENYTLLRTVGDKTMYFIEGAEKAKKGVAVIVQNGKIQTMMPTSPKDFLKLQ